MGTTGWMFAVYFMACAGPMPKSQLFWIGTLMRLATGFEVSSPIQLPDLPWSSSRLARASWPSRPAAGRMQWTEVFFHVWFVVLWNGSVNGG